LDDIGREPGRLLIKGENDLKEVKFVGRPLINVDSFRLIFLSCKTGRYSLSSDSRDTICFDFFFFITLICISFGILGGFFKVCVLKNYYGVALTTLSTLGLVVASASSEVFTTVSKLPSITLLRFLAT